MTAGASYVFPKGELAPLLDSAASPFILSGSKLLRSSWVSLSLDVRVVVRLWVGLLLTFTRLSYFCAGLKIAVSQAPPVPPTVFGSTLWTVPGCALLLKAFGFERVEGGVFWLVKPRQSKESSKISLSSPRYRWLEVQVDNLTCTQRWVQYLRLLQESIWPGGVLPGVPKPLRTEEQKAEAEKQALQVLMGILPGELPVLCNRSATNELCILPL